MLISSCELSVKWNKASKALLERQTLEGLNYHIRITVSNVAWLFNTFTRIYRPLEQYMQVNYKVPVDWFSLIHSFGKSCLVCLFLRPFMCLFGQTFSVCTQILISKSLEWFQLNLILEAYIKYYKVKLFLKWQDFSLSCRHQVTACDVCSVLEIYALLFILWF